MTVNTHNLKMIGLKKASGETRNYGDYSDRYDEILYNLATGEITTRYHVSLGQNSWTQISDPDVIRICNAQRHMTMQQIADAIAQRVAEIREDA